MAHRWIARCYGFGLEKLTAVELVEQQLAALGYETTRFCKSAMGVPLGLKVTIAEPEDRESRESAIAALDDVFGKVASKNGVKYRVGRTVAVSERK